MVAEPNSAANDSGAPPHLAGGEIGVATIRRKRFTRVHDTEGSHLGCLRATRSRKALLRATNSPRHESVAIGALASGHEDRSRADLTEKSRVASIRSFSSSCLFGACKRARVASSSRCGSGTTNDNAAAAKPVSATFVGHQYSYLRANAELIKATYVAVTL